MKNLLKTLMLLLVAQYASAQEGTWSGSIDNEGTPMGFVFHIEKEGPGYIGTLDIPSQGAMEIPISNVKIEGDKVTFDLAAVGLQYQGLLTDQKITGHIMQGDEKEELILIFGEPELPGDTELPSSDEVFAALAANDKGNYKYKVEDFFSDPNISTFRISPDGKYISYKEKDENQKRHVYVKDLATGKVTRVIEEKENLILFYAWKSPTHMIYIMDNAGDENYHIYSVKYDGSGSKDLTPFEGVAAEFLHGLAEDDQHLIIALNKDNPEIYEPYKLNIETGKLTKLFENKDAENPIDEYYFDKDAKLRAYTKLKDGLNKQFYYSTDGKKFKKIMDLSWKDDFSIAVFNYSSENPDDAYVISNVGTDKSVVQLYDLKANKSIKTVFENPDYDVSDLDYSWIHNYEIDYFAYVGEKNIIVPNSDRYKKIHDRITKEFPGYEYRIADNTKDESKYLITIGSDRLYGKYYSYDTKTDKFEFLVDLMPQLREEDMSPMKPITFKSRDGKTIHGYITMPKDATPGQKVPVIVNVHGGPQGVRDEWGFNPEAQLFASRGYATLFVNFRVSGGYGREFLESGYGEVGRKCMDDVEDGLQYAIDQGWVDAKKAAIYGASHGGYAVLRGLTKTPDLYACGVDYVGVSNLFTFMSSMPPYWKPYIKMIKEIWYDEEDPAQYKIMKEVSPIEHVDKIKKPLMVAQGANDPRVNINESDQIVKSLRARGIDVPYMVKYDEGHGFQNEDNSLDLYRAMMGFFAQNLK